MGAAAMIEVYRLSGYPIVTDAHVLKVLGSGDAERLTTDESITFTTADIFGHKSYAAGVPTSNAANVYLGLGSTYLSLIVVPGEQIRITAPPGAKYRLYDWYLKGTATDGVLVRYV